MQSGGAPDASWLWLLAYFVVITIGELYLSPIGLSLCRRSRPDGGFDDDGSVAGNKLCRHFIGGGLAATGAQWTRRVFLMIAGVAAFAGS